MAINFGDTIMEGSIEPNVRVQQPVQDNSGAVLAQALAPAARAVGAIAGSIFQQGQQDANAKILTQYENDLLNIADAVDQNAMSRNEAMIKARNLRRQYLANAPALQDDFDTVWSDFAGANGLGHVVISGTREQQVQEEMQNAAAKLGYTTDEFALFQSRTRQATELSYQLTQAQNSGQLITETQKLQGLQAVVGVAQSAYPSAQRQINEAMAAIQANPNNKQEIAAQLNNVMGNSIAQLKFVGGSADTGYITAPIEQAMTTFNQWVNGEVSNSVMEGELKTTQLKYDLMYATDPTLGPVIAASKVIGEVGMQNSQLFGQLFTPEVIQKFGQMANPSITVNLTDNSDASARTSEAIRQSAGMVNNESDPELIQEINNAISQAVDSAYVHERSADGAMGFKDIVELLGSSEVGAFLSTHGSIDSKYANQFVGVLKQNYEQELLPVINRAWTEPVPLVTPGNMGTGNPNQVVGGMENIPMNQLLEPRWNGNAVEFVPTEAYASNPRVIQLAQDVTSGDNSIGIPLNNLINAYSNVTGVDGKTIYEQDFAGRLFGVTEDGRTTSPLAVEPGNIDLLNRPVVRNADGSISTERSFSVNIDGLEVILPTVINGKIVSEEEAIQHYYDTGEHLGKYNTPAEAEAAAEQIHLDQEQRYSDTLSIGDFNPDTLEPIQEYTNQASSLTTELPPLDPAYTNVEGINYDSYLPSIRRSESSGNDAAKNPLSTATGRYQFLTSTWNDLVRRYPNSGLTPEGRLDPQQQEVAIRLFTAENARMLKGSGIPLNNGTLYAAHFLGAGDAAKVLKASNGLVSDYVPAKVIRANPFLRGMTVSQFKAWANRKGNA